MRNIIIDNNGNEYDELAERNEEIKANLEDVLQDFLAEQARDKTGRKKFGFRFLQQIEEELSGYDRMSADEFVNITADDLDYVWRKFHSLITYYNRFFEIVPNRESFMLFARLNSRQYKQLMESQDDDIKSAITFIEDRLVGKGWSAGESGNANDKAIKSRLSASGEHGHSIVSASEEKMINAVVGKTPQELEREMKAILGGDIKALK